MTFPFTDIQEPECGLFVVHGCNSTIQLEAGGVRYDLLDAHLDKHEFHVRDPELQKMLKERNYCSLRNISLPKSPFASLTVVSHSLTLFSFKTVNSCFHHPQSLNQINCSPFTLYYNDTAGCATGPCECYDSECSGIQVPIKEDSSADLCSRLTPDFTLQWNVSEDCNRCYRSGGQCFSNARNEFYCKKDGVISVLSVCAGSSPLTLILAVSGGGLLLLFLCLLSVFYIIRLRRKIINLSYLHSRKISFGPSPSEIDGGSFFFGIPIFSYIELEEATNNFDPSKEIGDGGFGTVYHGKLRDGREVAVKRLYEQNCRRMEQFINEIKILTSLRHQNLVSLYGCTSRRSRELLLVYEYIPNGTVADHLHGDRTEEAPLTWPIRMRIAVETATALSYLHKSDIIHRDVKTDNILLDKNFHVKVADFGLSRLFPYDASHISTAPGGTPGYIDPDYHQCYQVTDKSDVYSFGVVLVELISSMPAVDISRQTHEINLANLAVTRIQRCAFDELIDPSLGYNFDAEVTRMTTSVAEIAFRCLQLEKEMRPSMGEVLAFLKDI